MLSGTNTPKALVSHVSGRIIKLFKSNNNPVRQDEIIGCMETIADWQEVLHLSQKMDTLCQQLYAGNENSTASLMQENYIHLGELQTAYQTFRQVYINYQTSSLNGYALRKKSLFEKDNALIGQSENAIHRQTDLYKQDLGINQSNLEKNKKLLEAKIISQAEYDKMASENIGKQMTLPQNQSTFINTETQRNNINKAILKSTISRLSIKLCSKKPPLVSGMRSMNGKTNTC